MRYISLFHCLLLAVLSSGLNLCTKDYYEGSEPRLLVKVEDAPDSRYAVECSVCLGGLYGSTATVEVNANHQWYIDDLSLYTLPNWCEVSLPSRITTGYVTDTSLTFTVKPNNEPPCDQTFELILRHAADPKIKVTIYVTSQSNNTGLLPN